MNYNKAVVQSELFFTFALSVYPYNDLKVHKLTKLKKVYYRKLIYYKTRSCHPYICRETLSNVCSIYYTCLFFLGGVGQGISGTLK